MTPWERIIFLCMMIVYSINNSIVMVALYRRHRHERVLYWSVCVFIGTVLLLILSGILLWYDSGHVCGVDGERGADGTNGVDGQPCTCNAYVRMETDHVGVVHCRLRDFIHGTPSSRDHSKVCGWDRPCHSVESVALWNTPNNEIYSPVSMTAVLRGPNDKLTTVYT